jgi:transposase
VLIDAGYFSDPNIDQLYESNIDFLSRLPVRNKAIYSKVLQECLPNLKRKENLVNYDGRYLYIASTEVKIGTNKDHTAYAYLGYDVDRAGDESHKAVLNARQNKITEAELQKALEDAGLFVIIASLPFRDEEILPAYYVRQLVEQYFDVGKSISHLTPLRVHSEEALYGHLMLSMMAATINLYIMKATRQFYAVYPGIQDYMRI